MIQCLLLMSGINTLIQTLIGSRLPVVMGPSYAYIIPVMTIINDNSAGNYDSEHQVGGHIILSVDSKIQVVYFLFL